MKTITVAGINEHVKDEYTRQAHELFRGVAHVQGYWVGREKGPIHGDIVIAVTYSAAPVIQTHIKNSGAHLILVNTTFSQSAIEILRTIPAGKKVLLVCEDGLYALQCIKLLEEMGIDHIEFLAYYAGMESTSFDDVDTALCMGYSFHRPSFVKEFIDIGWRLITPESLQHVLRELDTDEGDTARRVAAQRGRVAGMQSEHVASIELDYAIRTRVQSVLNAMPLGVLVIDEQGRIEIYNGTLCRILGVNSTVLVNQRVEENRILGEVHALLARSHLKENVYYYSKDLDRAFMISRNEAVFLFNSFREVVMIEELDGRGNGAPAHRLAPSAALAFAPRESTAFRAKYNFLDIVAVGPRSLEAVALAKKYARTEAPVLIVGQTGTGKELYAHAIHDASPRRDGPFVSINCGAIPDELLESELFGYEKGSFTGANAKGKKGLLEVANHGTVFLDEVSDASMRFQVKLLRVLQEGEFTKIGGVDPSSIDVRIIAATNTPLETLKAGGAFRRDIFFRLSTFILSVPSLRERREDIPALVERFLGSHGYREKVVTPELLVFLLGYPWEGNVRELRNCVEYLGCLGGDRLTLADLPSTYRAPGPLESISSSGAEVPDVIFGGLDSRERKLLAAIMEQLADDRGAGRRSLTAFLRQQHGHVTEYAVRRYLEILESADFIRRERGRGGCRLGEMGRKWLFSV